MLVYFFLVDDRKDTRHGHGNMRHSSYKHGCESLHFDSLGLHAWLGRLTRASRYFGCFPLVSGRIAIDDTEVGIACATSTGIFFPQEARS